MKDQVERVNKEDATQDVPGKPPLDKGKGKIEEVPIKNKFFPLLEQVG